MLVDSPAATNASPNLSSVSARLARKFRIRGLLPWGESIPYFRAESEEGPLVIAALPFECPETSQADNAFRRLTRRLSALSGPSVPALVGHGVEDGVPYLAFEQPSGRPLSEHLSEGRVPSHVLLRIAD